MLKYLDTKVVFREVPDEVTLAINITNCPFKCDGCHTPDLQKDIGKLLTLKELDRLIQINKGITCIAIMGGDSEPFTVQALLDYVKGTYDIKTCWYSGSDKCPEVSYNCIDYLKIGHYNKRLGGLDSPDTNQKFFRIVHCILCESNISVELDTNLHICNTLQNITFKFQNKNV